MATTIRRSISVAALAAALSLVLAACGGGGGGGSTPPSNPPPTGDTVAPRVTSVTPTPGATGVAPTTPVVVTYEDEGNLACAGINGTTVMAGGYEAVVTCEGAAKKVTLAFRTSLPLGATVPVVVPPVSDMAGNPAPAVNVTFTVAAPVVTTPKLYVSLSPGADGSNAVAIIDRTSGTVSRVGFPSPPGFASFSSIVVNSKTGKVYFASRGAFKIYVRALVGDVVLPSIDLDPTLATNHLVWGLTLTETDICAAMSNSIPEGASQNRVVCFDQWTHVQTYSGANNSLASAAMFTTGLQYGTNPSKWFYAINGLTTAVGVVFPPAGTPGTLVKLHPTTYAVQQTYQVGSSPSAFRVHEVSGQVYVANSGDKNISIVDPASGRTELMDLGFTRMQQRPEDLVLAVAKNLMFVTDGESKVYAYSLSSRQEVDQLILGAGSFPKKLVMLGDELWVTCGNGTVVVVNIGSTPMTIARTLTLGGSPVAFANYAPGSSQ